MNRVLSCMRPRDIKLTHLKGATDGKWGEGRALLDSEFKNNNYSPDRQRPHTRKLTILSIKLVHLHMYDR